MTEGGLSWECKANITLNKLINVIHHINGLEKKKITVISINAESHLTKLNILS